MLRWTQQIPSFGLVFFVGMASAVQGQDVTNIAPAVLNRMIERGELASLSGKRLRFEAKFQECWGNRISLLLYASIKVYVPPESPMEAKLKKNQDSQGQALVNEASNVRIEASVVAAEVGVLLRLESITRLEDDQVRFEARGKAAGNDLAARERVATEAREWARLYRLEGLDRWALAKLREILAERAKKLADADVTGWLNLAGDYDRILSDRVTAVALLDRLYPETKDREQRALIAEKLQGFGATYSKRHWIPFAEFMRLEGRLPRKVDDKTAWVTPLRAEFLEFMEVDRKRATDETIYAMDALLQQNAKGGKVEVGMRPVHVSLLALNKGPALGLPSLIDRARWIDGQGKSRIYEQWLFDDEARFYFCDGRLQRWLAKSTPLPQK